jgi:hypothetical protein
MSTLTLKDATDAIYTSLKNDNEDLDLHIANLKSVLKAEGKAEAVFEPARLVQNNREGRKMMQAYFKKRGVKVSFGA